MNRRDEKSINLLCTVTPGRGQASKSRAQDVEVLSKIIGHRVLPGSLNLVVKKPVFLDEKKAFYARLNHFYWHVTLRGIPVILNRWSGAPAHVFEIFSHAHFRITFGLVDYDSLILTLPAAFLDKERSNSSKNRLVWSLFWRYRESFFYTSDFYTNSVRSGPLRRYLWRATQ